MLEHIAEGTLDAYNNAGVGLAATASLVKVLMAVTGYIMENNGMSSDLRSRRIWPVVAAFREWRWYSTRRGVG